MGRMNALPPFNADGVLPPGDYELTIEQLLASSLVVARGAIPGWNAGWRRRLVENLSVLVGHLVTVGITRVYVDGSFVEDKPVPNDVDGYFECEADRWLTGDLPDRLRALDPVWTWESSRREPFRDYPKPQLPMWHKYRVELFPDFGQFCGILDDRGRPLTFAQAFRQSREFRPKGIIRIGGLS